MTVKVTDVDDAEESTGIPLLAEYDPDGDGVILTADMRLAVANYFGPSADVVQGAHMRRLVRIYFTP